MKFLTHYIILTSEAYNILRDCFDIEKIVIIYCKRHEHSTIRRKFFTQLQLLSFSYTTVNLIHITS